MEGTANVEDVGLWPVFPGIREKKVIPETLAATGHADNERVRYLAVVEVEVVRRGVVRLQDRKVLGAKVRVRFLAGWIMKRNERSA